MTRPNVQPCFIVIMGVAGCGKSTIAKLTADRLAWAFIEGDSLHPPINVEKMRQGTPLNDDDRSPWLRSIARTIKRWRKEGKSGVVACSALRRAYREIIAEGQDDVLFVHLHGDPELIARRLAERRGHFMPADLLDSQIATLERPMPDEHAISLDIAASPETLVDKVVQAIAGSIRTD